MKITSLIYSSFILTLLLGTLAHFSISSVLANDASSSEVALSVVKTDNATTAQPGEVLTYSIILTNSEAEDVSVRIVDQIPAFLLPVATSPEADANAEARTITWDQIVIPAQEEIVVGVQAQVADDAPQDHLIENIALVTGKNIELSVSDQTQVAIKEVASPPIQPTAPTGSPTSILAASFLFLISGAVGSKIMISKKA